MLLVIWRGSFLSFFLDNEYAEIKNDHARQFWRWFSMWRKKEKIFFRCYSGRPGRRKLIFPSCEEFHHRSVALATDLSFTLSGSMKFVYQNDGRKVYYIWQGSREMFIVNHPTFRFRLEEERVKAIVDVLLTSPCMLINSSGWNRVNRKRRILLLRC